MLKILYPVIKTKICRTFGRLAVPYKINLHITYSCNSRCKICSIWKKYLDKPAMRRNELTAGQWKEFFEKSGNKLYWVSISGGEPFMRDDISDILSSIKTKNLCLFSINTNGQLPEKTYADMKEILGALPETVKVFLAVTLLGSEKTHNLVSGKKNAFREAEKTYGKLKFLQQTHKNFHLERELVVNKHNLNEIPGIVDKLNARGITFTLTFAQESDYYENLHGFVEFSQEEKKMIAEMLKNLQIPVHQKEHIVRRKFQKAAIEFFKTGRIHECYSSWSSVRIDPYGNVYPCIMKNEIIGNLVKNGMDLEKTMMSSENLKEVQKEIKGGKCSCWTPCEAYQGVVQDLIFDVRVLGTLFKRTKR